MKRTLLLVGLWLSVLLLNGCVGVQYPDEYREWPEEERSEWREEHPLRPWERYENGGEEEEEEEEEGEEEHFGDRDGD
jgi:hypothetical protein